MREFYIKNKPLIILWLLCITALIIFMGHYSNILFDVGRETYYPQRILEGKVLYKDLFNIYGPFSYLWNAFLYKIFGINLRALYISGAICSLAIVSGVYLIAKRFLNTSLSFAIGLFTIVTGVCANHLFNYTFPYSWAMLYGTVGFLYSVYFLIKYKDNENPYFLYMAGLLAGFAAANKYDFIIYSIFLFCVSIFTKNKKNILNFITSFMVFPILSFGILFLQGLRIEDLIVAMQEIQKLMNTKTLEYFYSNQGVLFSPAVFPVWIYNLLATGIPLGLMMLSYRFYEKIKIVSIALITIFALVGYKFLSPALFAFLTPLLFLVSIFGYKKIKTNIPLLLVIISAIGASFKTFWGLTPMSYGCYYTPIVLIAFFGVMFTFINEKYQKIAALFLIFVSFSFLNVYLFKRTTTTGKISSPHGTIYTYKQNADNINNILSILNNDENVNSTALIYPEGMIINFLSKNNIKSDDYYNSLLPLYLESMGEEKFQKVLDEKNPKFIILTSQNTSDYYFNHICTNYAFNFCNQVEQEYQQEATFNGDIAFKIYRKR